MHLDLHMVTWSGVEPTSAGLAALPLLKGGLNLHCEVRLPASLASWHAVRVEIHRTEQNRLRGLQPARLIALRYTASPSANGVQGVLADSLSNPAMSPLLMLILLRMERMELPAGFTFSGERKQH